MTQEYLKDILQWQWNLWKIPLLFWEKTIHWDTFNYPIALEIGAREGGLSLWLANKNFKVVCSDIQNPKIAASTLHEKYNVHEKIEYQIIDATNIPYENYFDIILFKSVLGGIGYHRQTEKQIKTIQQIYKALKPSGYLLFAENAKGSYVHHLLRKNRQWSTYWNYLNYDFFKKNLSLFQNYKIKGTGFCSTLLPFNVTQKFLIHIDQLFNKFIPLSCQPILYGIAQK